ncbi:hypothetical protein HDU85_007168 [Gaertneriomyces sp. JEL0708]|nr:hypothetical protein HDU85_007168 [Gaertneriomyces sp. JEL0708]
MNTAVAGAPDGNTGSSNSVFHGLLETLITTGKHKHQDDLRTLVTLLRNQGLADAQVFYSIFPDECRDATLRLQYQDIGSSLKDTPEIPAGIRQLAHNRSPASPLASFRDRQHSVSLAIANPTPQVPGPKGSLTSASGAPGPVVAALRGQPAMSRASAPTISTPEATEAVPAHQVSQPSTPSGKGKRKKKAQTDQEAPDALPVTASTGVHNPQGASPGAAEILARLEVEAETARQQLEQVTSKRKRTSADIQHLRATLLAAEESLQKEDETVAKLKRRTEELQVAIERKRKRVETVSPSQPAKKRKGAEVPQKAQGPVASVAPAPIPCEADAGVRAWSRVSDDEDEDADGVGYSTGTLQISAPIDRRKSKSDSSARPLSLEKLNGNTTQPMVSGIAANPSSTTSSVVRPLGSVSTAKIATKSKESAAAISEALILLNDYSFKPSPRRPVSSPVIARLQSRTRRWLAIGASNVTEADAPTDGGNEVNGSSSAVSQEASVPTSLERSNSATTTLSKHPTLSNISGQNQWSSELFKEASHATTEKRGASTSEGTMTREQELQNKEDVGKAAIIEAQQSSNTTQHFPTPSQPAFMEELAKRWAIAPNPIEMKRQQDELSRQHDDTGGRLQGETRRRKEEKKVEESTQKQNETKRLQEEVEGNARRQAEELRRQQEEKKNAQEAARRLEAELKRQQEENKNAQEVARRLEDELRRQQEQKKKAQEAARRQEELKRQQEEKKKAQEAARRLEAELKRQQEEKRKAQEEVARRQEELKMQQEEEKNAQEVARRLEDELRRQQEEKKKAQENARSQLPEKKVGDALTRRLEEATRHVERAQQELREIEKKRQQGKTVNNIVPHQPTSAQQADAFIKRITDENSKLFDVSTEAAEARAALLRQQLLQQKSRTSSPMRSQPAGGLIANELEEGEIEDGEIRESANTRQEVAAGSILENSPQPEQTAVPGPVSSSSAFSFRCNVRESTLITHTTPLDLSDPATTVKIESPATATSSNVLDASVHSARQRSITAEAPESPLAVVLSSGGLQTHVSPPMVAPPMYPFMMYQPMFYPSYIPGPAGNMGGASADMKARWLAQFLPSVGKETSAVDESQSEFHGVPSDASRPNQTGQDAPHPTVSAVSTQPMVPMMPAPTIPAAGMNPYAMMPGAVIMQSPVSANGLSGYLGPTMAAPFGGMHYPMAFMSPMNYGGMMVNAQGPMFPSPGPNPSASFGNVVASSAPATPTPLGRKQQTATPSDVPQSQ